MCKFACQAKKEMENVFRTKKADLFFGHDSVVLLEQNDTFVSREILLALTKLISKVLQE